MVSEVTAIKVHDPVVIIVLLQERVFASTLKDISILRVIFKARLFIGVVIYYLMNERRNEIEIHMSIRPPSDVFP